MTYGSRGLVKWLRSTEVVHYLGKIEVGSSILPGAPYARLAQLVEHETLNFGVVGSRPTVGTKNPAPALKNDGDSES